MKKGIRYYLRSLHISLRNLYDYFTAEYILFPRADLLHLRGEVDQIQLVVTSRILDIQNYMNGDKSFYFQNRISTALFGDKHDQPLGDSRFSALIESVKANGYDNEHSLLTVDRNFTLVDGTHRLAIAFWANIPYVRVKVVRWKSNHKKVADWFLNPLFSTADLSRIRKAYAENEERMFQSGLCFCCVIKTAQLDLAEQVAQDVSNVTQVVYQKPLSSGGLIVGFWVDYPMFYVNKGKLVSRRVEQIEKMLQMRYPMLRDKMTFAYNSVEGQEAFKEFSMN
ncbi:MAG: hypothetical protein IJS89_01055 [Bacteroidaceae bacterium]|nr:hypothetical protein [Bacteroidaceae bacterium]